MIRMMRKKDEIRMMKKVVELGINKMEEVLEQMEDEYGFDKLMFIRGYKDVLEKKYEFVEMLCVLNNMIKKDEDNVVVLGRVGSAVADWLDDVYYIGLEEVFERVFNINYEKVYDVCLLWVKRWKEEWDQ